MTEPTGPAETAPSSAQCAQHQAAAVGTCERCGDYYCERAGAPPSRGSCRRCDGQVGSVPWEHDRTDLGALRAFGRTLLRLLIAPTELARRLPVEGPLPPPVAFAAIACSLYLVMATLLFLALLVLRLLPVLSRFDAEEIVWRTVLLSDYVPTVVILAISTPLILLLTPACLAITVRALGGHLSLRAGVRIIAYASGYFVFLGVPLGGLASILLFPLFLYRVLEARTGLSQHRRVFAIGLLLSAVVLIRFITDTVYTLTLEPLVTAAIDNILDIME